LSLPAFDDDHFGREPSEGKPLKHHEKTIAFFGPAPLDVWVERNGGGVPFPCEQQLFANVREAACFPPLTTPVPSRLP
jgi:hypothetical protein